MKLHPLYICYRSFNPQLERTKDFAEMGVPTRCFFAANTINALGKPYCDYPLIWKGFKDYDWSALDAQIESAVFDQLERQIAPQPPADEAGE